jgi:gliding motility-associated-like protein
VVTPTATTTYTVNGEFSSGCSGSDVITITVFNTPTVTAIPANTTVCSGASLNLSTSGAASYLWSTGSANTTITVNPVTNTVYTVTGTNGAGCTATASIGVTVYANPTISLGPDVEVYSGESYPFNPSQTGAVSYTWSPSSYLNSTSVINPVTTPESDITYILTVTSIDGCTASDTVMVRMLINELIIANYMSPNGDGVNDTWKVNAPVLIKDYSIEIVDSYGKSVFKAGNNYNNEFDGKLGGQDLPDGVYYYFIKDGNSLKYKGSITLTK